MMKLVMCCSWHTDSSTLLVKLISMIDYISYKITCKNENIQHVLFIDYIFLYSEMTRKLILHIYTVCAYVILQILWYSKYGIKAFEFTVSQW